MIGLFIKVAPVWICFLLVWCLLHLLADRKAIRGDFSLLWILATIATGLLLVSIAELASFFNLLVSGFVVGAWITVDVVLAVVFARLSSSRGQRIGATLQVRIRQWCAGFKGSEGVAKCLMAVTAGFIVALGLCAAKTPTTIWDCQTYHMPRIMHWLQQHSLRHYPTNIPRQLESSPGAEIEMAQLIALTGDDQPVNLPEWWALLTAAIAASFLARELLQSNISRKAGGEKPSLELAGAFVFLLAATLPEAAAEAPTAQNNLLAAMWTLSAVTLGFLFAENPGNNIYALAAGAALALGMGVKPTAFLYATPFVLLALLYFAGKKLWGPLWRLAAISLALCLGCNGPWMMRNQAYFGTPLGSKETFAAQRMVHHSPKKIAVNVIRNLSLYTRSPSDIATTLVNFSIESVVRATGEDIADTNATFHGSSLAFTKKAIIQNGEGWGNCYTVLLLLICLPVFIFKFRLISPLGAHLLAVAAGFILFCGYLRFQPWHSRLHLGYFLLAAPFIGVVLVSWCDRWIIALTGCFLMTNVILVLVFNPVVPIVASVAGRESREDLYFGTRTDLRAPMKALADDIIQSGCTNVLLKVGGDSWEYPVWFLLRDRGFTGSIHHTLVGKKATAFLDESPLPPKTVIVTELEVAPVIESLPRQKAYGDWAVYYRP